MTTVKETTGWMDRRSANSSAFSAGRLALHACRRSLSPNQTVGPLVESLHATYKWLCNAQDITGDGGVAGWYHLFRGWASSYPETTGYIIPSFLAYGDAFPRSDAKARAIQMADFETAVQLPTGAVRSGVLGRSVAPAVFNTGQVLFGWTAAFKATGDERYASAAARAAEWLVSRQDDDGAWRKDLSQLTTSKVQTYNVRTAWGLALSGLVFNERKWVNAARKNCDWALKQQNTNGWFAHNGFSETQPPLLHTIGYAIEGLLGAGELLQEEKYIDAAERGVLPIAALYSHHHVLHGRYDFCWRATVRWRCLTGEAQIALVLARLAQLRQDTTLAEVSVSLLKGLSQLQDTTSSDSESYGALSGSAPIWGLYCPFKYVNWAAKFYLDALLLHMHHVDVHALDWKRPRALRCPKDGSSLHV